MSNVVQLFAAKEKQEQEDARAQVLIDGGMLHLDDALDTLMAALSDASEMSPEGVMMDPWQFLRGIEQIYDSLGRDYRECETWRTMRDLCDFFDILEEYDDDE